MRVDRPMFKTIGTERLSLRQLSASDAKPMFAYRSDPTVTKYQNWVPASIDEMITFIDGLALHGPDTPGKWFQIGIALGNSDELIGDCGIRISDSNPQQAEVGISLNPGFHHRGFATEALNALLEFIFASLDKHRVFASVDPRNEASMTLLNRVGMRKEAHFVESYWFKGTWVDDVIFALLKREWTERNES